MLTNMKLRLQARRRGTYENAKGKQEETELEIGKLEKYEVQI
jgi:hypothetical protein